MMIGAFHQCLACQSVYLCPSLPVLCARASCVSSSVCGPSAICRDRSWPPIATQTQTFKKLPNVAFLARLSVAFSLPAALTGRRVRRSVLQHRLPCNHTHTRSVLCFSYWGLLGVSSLFVYCIYVYIVCTLFPPVQSPTSVTGPMYAYRLCSSGFLHLHSVLHRVLIVFIRISTSTPSFLLVHPPIPAFDHPLHSFSSLWAPCCIYLFFLSAPLPPHLSFPSPHLPSTLTQSYHSSFLSHTRTHVPQH